MAGWGKNPSEERRGEAISLPHLNSSLPTIFSGERGVMELYSGILYKHSFWSATSVLNSFYGRDNYPFFSLPVIDLIFFSFWCFFMLISHDFAGFLAFVFIKETIKKN